MSKRNFPESSMERWRCLQLLSISQLNVLHFCLRSVFTFLKVIWKSLYCTQWTRWNNRKLNSELTFWLPRPSSKLEQKCRDQSYFRRADRAKDVETRLFITRGKYQFVFIVFSQASLKGWAEAFVDALDRSWRSEKETASRTLNLKRLQLDSAHWTYLNGTALASLVCLVVEDREAINSTPVTRRLCPWYEAIFELLFASVSKRVLVHNHSNGNEWCIFMQIKFIIIWMV